jgi:hypothetical protein
MGNALGVVGGSGIKCRACGEPWPCTVRQNQARYQPLEVARHGPRMNTDPPQRYRVVRFYANANMRRRTLRQGVTLETAQRHCLDPETNSQTAKGYAARKRTEALGPWFDGYERMGGER